MIDNLDTRFGDLPPEIVEAINTLEDLLFLKQLRRQAIVVESIEAFQRLLSSHNFRWAGRAMSHNLHIGSNILAFLAETIPDTAEMPQIEQRELFRFNLAQTMRNLREQAGFTQAEFAAG